VRPFILQIISPEPFEAFTHVFEVGFSEVLQVEFL
tara:strand:- start:151 stop:255 length:105 start_codon:yes stop_codon:yes gene_type:complete